MKSISQLEEQISSLEQRVSVLEKKLENPNSVKPVVGKKKILSEREYLRDKKPASIVEKTLFLGNYLEEHKGIDSFTAEDLRNAFRAACEPYPSNINDNINKNIRKGFFMEDAPKEDKKAWVLTLTGEKLVREKLGNK